MINDGRERPETVRALSSKLPCQPTSTTHRSSLPQLLAFNVCLGWQSKSGISSYSFASPHPRSLNTSMPKAPKTRPKKHKPDLPPSLPPRPPAPKFTATKETILEILLAKVEDSRSFDWHGLSEKLHLPAADTPAGKFKGKGNPRRGGKEADGCARLCGTDLCEIFYQVDS
jgi:hypothetical protein